MRLNQTTPLPSVAFSVFGIFAILMTVSLTGTGCGQAHASGPRTAASIEVQDIGDAYDEVPTSELGERPRTADDDSPTPFDATEETSRHAAAVGYTSTMNHVQRAVVRANSQSSFRGSTDCVLNARDTIARATRYSEGTFRFASSDAVADSLIPHAASAKAIGSFLRLHWRTQLNLLHHQGMYDWHPLDIKAIARERNGGIWSNGVVFSQGGSFGHVSTHVWEEHAGGLELDQYSATAFHANVNLLTLLLSGDLPADRKPTTLPALINRVASTIMFQWCNESWGCPARGYWLDQ